MAWRVIKEEKKKVRNGHHGTALMRFTMGSVDLRRGRAHNYRAFLLSLRRCGSDVPSPYGIISTLLQQAEKQRQYFFLSLSDSGFYSLVSYTFETLSLCRLRMRKREPDRSCPATDDQRPATLPATLDFFFYVNNPVITS